MSANIAEGCGGRPDGEFVRFLPIARGPASEVECHLLLARDLKFMPNSAHGNLQGKLTEIQRMLSSLVSAVEEQAGSAAREIESARAGPAYSGQWLGTLELC